MSVEPSLEPFLEPPQLPLWRRTLNLFVPSRCQLCRALGDVLCPSCFVNLPLRPHPVERGELRGLAAADYEPPFDQLIGQFKDAQNASLDVFLAKAMCAALPAQSGVSSASLVPIPSSREAFSKRGFVPAEVLAEGLARAFASGGGPRPRVVAGLRRVRAGADQASLGVAARAANQSGAFRALPALADQEVWLVDDIVTTGATLQEAARAIESVGGHVLGFLVFAETLLKRDTQNSKWV